MVGELSISYQVSIRLYFQELLRGIMVFIRRPLIRIRIPIQFCEIGAQQYSASARHICLVLNYCATGNFWFSSYIWIGYSCSTALCDTIFFFFFSIVVNMICWDLFSITFTCMHLRHYFYYTQNDLYYAQNGPVVVKNIVFLDLLLWFLSTWFYKFNVSYNVEYMKLRAWMETFVISFCSCLVFLVSLLARFCLIIYLFLIGW